MSFEILPAIENPHSTVCHICGCGAHETLSMDRMLAVGFGDVVATRDGEHVYSESAAPKPESYDDYWTAQRVEDMAALDPDHDWQIRFIAPMYGATYQRHGPDHWVLVEKNRGFA